MKKTFVNISAVANMTGQRMPEGWRAFHGSTKLFLKQAQYILKRPSTSKAEFTHKFYPNPKSSRTAHINLSSILTMLGLR